MDDENQPKADPNRSHGKPQKSAVFALKVGWDQKQLGWDHIGKAQKAAENRQKRQAQIAYGVRLDRPKS